MNTNNKQLTTQEQQMFPANSNRDHLNAGTVAIEEQRAIAEAQGKLIIAKRFPRDQVKAYEQIMQTCKRRSFAEMSMYAYPRGGETIKGPSIRMAEELARAWGNIDFGVRELSDKNGVTEVEAYCWDLETNTYSSMKFTVKHERHTKAGVRKLTDPRDIYEVMANNAGRRLRARILAVIPPDLVEAAVSECAKTLAGNTTEPLIDRVRKMLDAFSKYGVTKAHIEERIKKPTEKIVLDELGDLIAIFNTIKDGVKKPSDWFGGIPDASQPEPPKAIANLNASVAATPTQQGVENAHADGGGDDDIPA